MVITDNHLHTFSGYILRINPSLYSQLKVVLSSIRKYILLKHNYSIKSNIRKLRISVPFITMEEFII